jgi:hypothetical protein
MNLQKIRGVGTQYLNIDTNENAIHNNKKLHKLAISEIINNLTEDLE